MEKFDIHVTLSVLAKNEGKAEEEVLECLKYALIVMPNPNIVDFELTEWIPHDNGSV